MPGLRLFPSGMGAGDGSSGRPRISASSALRRRKASCGGLNSSSAVAASIALATVSSAWIGFGPLGLAGDELLVDRRRLDPSGRGLLSEGGDRPRQGDVEGGEVGRNRCGRDVRKAEGVRVEPVGAGIGETVHNGSALGGYAVGGDPGRLVGPLVVEGFNGGGAALWRQSRTASLPLRKERSRSRPASGRRQATARRRARRLRWSPVPYWRLASLKAQEFPRRVRAPQRWVLPGAAARRPSRPRAARLSAPAGSGVRRRAVAVLRQWAAEHDVRRRHRLGQGWKGGTCQQAREKNASEIVRHQNHLGRQFGRCRPKWRKTRSESKTRFRQSRYSAATLSGSASAMPYSLSLR